MKILNSASKIVFILLAITVCVAFILEKLSAQDFMLLTSGVFAFYFAQKRSSGDSNDELGGK